MVIVILIGAILTVSFSVVLFLAIVFAFGGLAYGVAGMTAIGIRWVRIPRQSKPEKPETASEVHLFRTALQRFTFMLNLLLLAILAVVSAGVLFSESPGLLVLLGGVLQVGALALIATNFFWACGRSYILGEHEALAFRVGAYRLIAVNRVVSYLVWAVGTAFAGFLVYQWSGSGFIASF